MTKDMTKDMTNKDDTFFEAFVPYNFTKLMVDYWVEVDEMSYSDAVAYSNRRFFKRFSDLISGSYRYFKYIECSGRNRCIEAEDCVISIPVSILEIDNITERMGVPYYTT